jgi:cysteine desulfurase/selenocysteine lyase
MTPSVSFDFEKIRQEVPQLKSKVHNQSLIYLDNAATTLKPQVVIDRLTQYYAHETANVHRGAHYFAELGTANYEIARQIVAEFLGARTKDEIVFTRGTTESLNLVAHALADSGRLDGGQIVISELEHHSNIVPWQLVAKRVNAKLAAVRIDEKGDIDRQHLRELLMVPTAVVALTACSNVLGTIVPVSKIADDVHAAGAIFVVDAAQSVTAEEMNVSDWKADFVAFSGHKLFAPFGIGVLWAKKPFLEELPPYQGGGSMIHQVSIDRSTWADVPQKFEAGTPNVGGALALAEAINWFKRHDPQASLSYAKILAEEFRMQLVSIEGVTIHGAPTKKSSIVSFNLSGVHPSDVATVLDQQGIAVRAGHLCCQPLMARLGQKAVVRASFSIYNTLSEVELLTRAIRKAKEILA